MNFNLIPYFKENLFSFQHPYLASLPYNKEHESSTNADQMKFDLNLTSFFFTGKKTEYNKICIGYRT